MVEYTLGGGRLISQEQGGDASYYLADGQNSTRNLTNQLGAITDSYRYAAFGELVGITGTTPNKYLYTGQQFDAATGQYSLRARYYQPGLGRFTARDQWAYDFQNPVEFNRYGYTANNPVNAWDPTGFALLEYMQIQERVREAQKGAFGHAFRQGVYGAFGGAFGVILASFILSYISTRYGLKYDSSWSALRTSLALSALGGFIVGFVDTFNQDRIINSDNLLATLVARNNTASKKPAQRVFSDITQGMAQTSAEWTFSLTVLTTMFHEGEIDFRPGLGYLSALVISMFGAYATTQNSVAGILEDTANSMGISNKWIISAFTAGALFALNYVFPPLAEGLINGLGA